MDNAQAVGWAAVALAALTMLKNIADAWVARTTAKDKLEFDHKLTLLEQQHGNCEEKYKSVDIKLKQCQEQHEDSSRERDSLKSEVNTVKQEAENTRRELEELKAMMNKFRSDTGKSGRLPKPPQPPQS